MKKHKYILLTLITLLTVQKSWTQDCDNVFIIPGIEIVTEISPYTQEDSIININYYDVCIGDTLQFIGNWSYLNDALQESPADSTFIWSHTIGSEKTTEKGRYFSYIFKKRGVHQIDLNIKDSLNCTNKEYEKVYVRVSHVEADEIYITPAEVCVDVKTELEVMTKPEPGAIVSMTGIYEFKDQQIFPEPDIIPDTAAACSKKFYEEKISVNSFSPKQKLKDINDFDEICINMEHEYAGKLTIELEAPNGNTVSLLSDENGNFGGNGLGLFYELGLPNVDDNPDCLPANNPAGTGMKYCWSPNNTDTTWHELKRKSLSLQDFTEESNDFMIIPSNTDERTRIYAAYNNSFNNLQNTPLNGRWTLKVENIDKDGNGYIFDWYIKFNNDIVPSNLIYKPVSTSFKWTNSDTIVSNTNKTNLETANPGYYDYEIDIVDNFGCKYSGIDSVFVPTKVLLDRYESLPDSCENRIGSVLVEGSGGTKPYTYFWNTLDKTDSTVLYLRAGDYPYTITDATNCKHEGIINVGQRSKDVTAAFSFELDTCTSHLNLSNESTNSKYFTWNYGADKLKYDRNIALPNLGEAYQIELIASNEHCADTIADSFDLTGTDAYNRIKNYLPNVFTPNDDSFNDVLSIKGLRECETGTLKIYNKWGDEVYYSVSPGLEPWDGTQFGEEVAEGTYFYVLKLNYAEFKGTVSLIR
ncbi:gliding motility-associated C-terminal domain-containing protein [Flavobacteriales bacterium]|nr:gliding motility-associated C-terminal domain-containing protein [Flavobacteriales bacterium]